MRIAYLNPCGKLGGAETSLRELLESVRQAKPSWDLWLILAQDGPLAEVARNLGVRVVLCPFPAELARIGDTQTGRTRAWLRLMQAGRATLMYSRSLSRCLREINPDLIHTNGLKMHLLGAWTRPAGKPLVWHIHDYVGTRRMMRDLLRVSQEACTVAIANSHSVERDLGTLLPRLKVTVVHNAVNLQRFSPEGKKLDLDQLAGLSPSGPEIVRVGLVATFARWKGHKVFLQALAEVPRDLPVRGYIIGAPIYQTDGSQWSMEELRAEAGRLGLNGKLGFTGFIEDTPAALRSLDVVVHASTSPEPFGMVIIEAMACGRAVIASQAGGAAELFTEEDALAHRPGDFRALATQISRLASDEALRKRLGARARMTAEQRWNGKRLGQQISAAYRYATGSADVLSSQTCDDVELVASAAGQRRR